MLTGHKLRCPVLPQGGGGEAVAAPDAGLFEDVLQLGQKPQYGEGRRCSVGRAHRSRNRSLTVAAPSGVR